MMDQDGILAAFLEAAPMDKRLIPSHIALFTAIFHLLKKTGSCTTVKITRQEVMQLAKISSISTYHKRINDLMSFQYLDYRPSYDHYKGSFVIFLIKKAINS